MMRTVIVTLLASTALGFVPAKIGPGSRRSMKTTITNQGDGLCSSANLQEVPLMNLCGGSESLILSEVDWQPCCSFSDNSDSACRTYTMGTPYCMSSVPECIPSDQQQGLSTCDQLTDQDKLTIELSFDVDIATDDCCKSCTCFGDPECSSFSGVEDLWIPCDGRRSGRDCKMYKDICTDMMGPNNKKCLWKGSKSNSAGTNFPMEGSPCVPDGGPDDVTMDMINTGSTRVRLGMGERGIIQNVEIKFGNKVAKLDAERCFEEGGATAWGLDSLPSNWVETPVDNELVSWWIKDTESSTLVRLVCLRTVDKNQNGLPRINVQEVAVEPNKNGDGFCFTDTIEEKAGDFLKSKDIHQSCTQNETTALQGCKYLVELGTPLGFLPECAESYCNLADISEKSKKSCLKKMKKSYKKVSNWINVYCEAVMNSPKAPETAPANAKACKKTVKKEGWPTAEALYGKGHKVLTDGQSPTNCGNSIQEYKVNPSDAQCEQGISIEVQMDDDSWETQYFVPVSKPFCTNNMMEVSYSEAPMLFSHAVRIKQCNAKMNDSRCSAVSSCAPSYGASFRMSYSTSISTIDDLLDQGLLQCVDKVVSGVVSNTWCFPDSIDYTPVDEVCPCPGRRLSETNRFLGKD